MARKKSIYDIRNQEQRIKRAIADRAGNNVNNLSGGDLARYLRVGEIASTYRGNIANSKSYQKAGRKETAREYVRGVAKSAQRKYSQSTYMGLTNG